LICSAFSRWEEVMDGGSVQPGDVPLNVVAESYAVLATNP
jgi:hypothetical protein